MAQILLKAVVALYCVNAYVFQPDSEEESVDSGVLISMYLMEISPFFAPIFHYITREDREAEMGLVTKL